MKVIETIKGLRNTLNDYVLAGKTIGFVPTMGALHSGHISLIDTAKKQSDVVVCSIFVNPTQFNNSNDLAIYPRTLEADCAMLKEAGCHIVFAPTVTEMYPNSAVLNFNFGPLEHVMEGKFRPGHFNGVGLVVSKLFNIIQAHKAFFGQKDIQQCAVIQTLINDLSFQIELVVCPTLRENDGLAMSSRNRNLTEMERSIAPHIFECMTAAHIALQNGMEIDLVKNNFAKEMKKQPLFTLEYFEIVDRATLQNVAEFQQNKQALCVAAFLGKTRLIDNFLI